MPSPLEISGEIPVHRIPAIDALRGVAVILMVQQHLGVWLWNNAGKPINAAFSDYSWYIIINWLGNLAAPLFIIIAGAGTVLFEDRHQQKDRVLITRGVFIIFMGYVLNLLSPHWFSLTSWYVLHLIGFCLALTPLSRRLPEKTLIPLILLMISLAVLLQTKLNTPLFLTNKQMGNDEPLRLALAAGHFPIFPWCGFFMLGILLGRWMKRKQYLLMVLLAFIVIGSAAVLGFFHHSGYAFATYGRFYRFFVPLPYFYPPLPPFILFLMGVSTLLFCGVSGALTPKNPAIMKTRNKCLWLSGLGRVSLTILFLHIVIFNELIRYWGIHSIFPAPISLLIIILILSLMVYITLIWGKYEYKYSLEWIMRRISG